MFCFYYIVFSFFCIMYIHKFTFTPVSPTSASMSGITEDYVEEGETYYLVCETSMKPEGNIVWVVNGEEMSTDNDGYVDDKGVWNLTGLHDIVVDKQEEALPLLCRVNYKDGGFWAENQYKTVSVNCKLN